MFTFTKLDLRNYLTWNEVSLEFESGVTLINGNNRSGKSLLVSPLRPLLYDSGPIPAQGRATFAFNNGEKNFEFTVFNQGKARNNFELSIDGQNQAVETRAAALALIERYFGYFVQESLFNTTVSLSGLNKHPLADGKPSSRLDWVHETLAYASLLDEYTEKVEQQLKHTREANTQYTLLHGQYNKLERPTKPDRSSADYREELQALEQRLNKHKTVLEETEAVLQYRQSQAQQRVPKHTIKQLTARLQRAQQQLEAFEQQHQAYKLYKKRAPAYEQLQSDAERAARQYRKLCAQYGRKAIPPAKAVQITSKIIAELEQKLQRAERENHKAEQQQPLQETARRKLHTNHDAASCKQIIAEFTEANAVLRTHIRALESGESTCTVCGSRLDQHDNLNTLKATYQKQRKQARKVQEDYDTLTAQHTLQTEGEAEIVDTNELSAALQQLQEIQDVAERYTHFKQRLADVGLPDRIDFDETQYADAVRTVERTQQALNAAQVYEQTQQLQPRTTRDYSDLSEAELVDQQRKYKRSVRTLRERREALTDALIRSETDSALYSKYVQDKRILKTQLQGVKSAARDFVVLKALQKALGRDGFRTKRLEKTLELFVDNLNALAPILWNEPFKFEIETGPRKCDVIIHRNRKRGNAFTLSGSEQRCWQLLAALAMLRLLPNNRRCDTILLDETEANMDPLSRQRMMRDFIPELRKTVPKVLLISPLALQELHVQPDRVYRVVKKNAQSQLHAQ